ncbi:MAG TPA: N-acetylglucosamine-6-phosphate deacetylase, partial [Lachnospiraceae bacterium]|nr:N-acetylglucosamine-6-phosphate deacetylase [Lachnospiraceae bacterium]
DAYIYQGPEKGFIHGEFEVKDGRFHNIRFFPAGECPQTTSLTPGMPAHVQTAGYLLREEPHNGCGRADTAECDFGNVTELKGAYVIPGLVDIHVHGSLGADFSDADHEGLRRMGRYLLTKGITSFLPTSMTLPVERLKKVFSTAKRMSEEAPKDAAKLLGINMEGPFFSAKRKGAQNEAYLRLPETSLFEELYEESNGLIRIVCVAPELSGGIDFIEKASRLCTVSLAHTDAGYSEARRAFEAGAGHVTHLFNAMPPFHHREPGVIGAAAEREDVTAELICDGLHVHESAVRLAFRLFPKRICLISDAARSLGMPDGVYELGGQQTYLRGKRLTLMDGKTIAASATDLFDCMKNAIAFGIPVKDAVYSATMAPARAAGIDALAGSIEPGKPADFIICDEELNRLRVYREGVPCA